MIHGGAFRIEARGRADFRGCVRLRTATGPHEVARTVFVCPACEEILCINFLFPFIVFLTQQQQVAIYELKMQTPEQWEHRDSCGGGNQAEDYPAQGNCREATLCNYPQWAADGSSEREAFHLTAGSTLDKSFAETLQTVINDSN